MKTECHESQLEFQEICGRRVVGAFDAGRTSSDAGLLLMREVSERTGLLRDFAGCFTDHRREDLIEHPLEQLLAQRVLGLACGYEDLSDHDVLRDDVLLSLCSGQSDLLGERRRREQDKGHALAGKSTLNRLELTPATADRNSRYQKVVYNADSIDQFFVNVFLNAHVRAPKQIVLDLDATDDPLHGKQEGRFFHGYYRSYCYLPLYIFCGDFLLCARLRRSNIDASAGSVEELERIVKLVRARWPKVEIIIRADSGFARESIMAFCEKSKIHYVVGLAKNARLGEMIAGDLELARLECERTAQPARRFRDLRYKTLKTWSRPRRVVAKAEQIPGKSNPRFVVTSIARSEVKAQELYEKLYCARGDMENRIKEQQLGLFADRTSTATMRANQLRLYFSSVAYVLMNELRRVGLEGTEMQDAQVGTIRVRLLKCAAVVTLSVRRVYVSLSSVFPLQTLFARVLEKLRVALPMPP